jgi:phosphohistidine phosphatase SixA
LSKKGITQTLNLGVYLKSKIDTVEIWCSDAIRTRETLDSISKACAYSQPKYLIDIYLCTKNDLLHHIWKRKSNDDLLIIGHNFGISDLLSYFVNYSIEMSTSEYYCIDFGFLASSEISKSTGIIVDQYHP